MTDCNNFGGVVTPSCRTDTPNNERRDATCARKVVSSRGLVQRSDATVRRKSAGPQNPIVKFHVQPQPEEYMRNHRKCLACGRVVPRSRVAKDLNGDWVLVWHYTQTGQNDGTFTECRGSLRAMYRTERKGVSHGVGRTA